jgi:hypothetical protein
MRQQQRTWRGVRLSCAASECGPGGASEGGMRAGKEAGRSNGGRRKAEGGRRQNRGRGTDDRQHLPTGTSGTDTCSTPRTRGRLRFTLGPLKRFRPHHPHHPHPHTPPPTPTMPSPSPPSPRDAAAAASDLLTMEDMAATTRSKQIDRWLRSEQVAQQRERVVRMILVGMWCLWCLWCLWCSL